MGTMTTLKSVYSAIQRIFYGWWHKVEPDPGPECNLCGCLSPRGICPDCERAAR